MKTKSITDLVTQIKGSEELKKKLAADPINFLENIKEENPIENKWVFLTIVLIVGIVLIAAVVLGSIIIFNSADNQTAKVPEFLVSIGSTALGAIVGLLAPSPKNN